MKVSQDHDDKVKHAGSVDVDQRLKGEKAVNNLLSVLSDIFDAEDQIQADAFDNGDAHPVSMFMLLDSDEGPIPVLLPAFQEKLDSSIHKVANCFRLDSIPIDSLKRAQNLCDRSISRAAYLSLQIGDDWSDADAEDWQQKLAIADNGLLATRTLLRIMLAGHMGKELQSEDSVRTMLETLKNVVETGFVSIVEERASLGEKARGATNARPNPKFAIAVAHKQFLVSLLHGLGKALRLLNGLLAKVDVDESAISSIVYMCKTLIFAENASTERESAMGIQTFEATRKYALDVLARIFTRYTEQRQYIFDEILLSLEKLPATKQSARQFRLPDSKPIQLVSALLMRLVQTSATNGKISVIVHKDADAVGEDDMGSDMSEDDLLGSSDGDEDGDQDENVSPSKPRGGKRDLATLIKPLDEAAQKDASYIIRILVQRALTTSKNAEEPYRKLLDIFTEDFLTVLGSSDWPSAELLLRTQLRQMISIVYNPKSNAPSCNFALELLGTMGSGILELQHRTHSAAKSLEASESKVAADLLHLFKQTESGDVDPHVFLSFTGPYRVALEYIYGRNIEDAQLQTAIGYHLVQWAQQVCILREGSVDSDASDTKSPMKPLRSGLRNMILDPHWLEANSDFAAVSTSEGKFAAMVLTLNSTFCRAFDRLFTVLLSSMNNEHPTVKSRCLKSVATLVELDPLILDRSQQVLKYVFRCAEDPSTLVRDSALGLVAKCMSLKPQLDVTVYEQIIGCSEDPAVGVRKRAMRMLKDIYLRNDSDSIRSNIANAIISRIHDNEESVTELARQTIEDIWFQPFYNAAVDGEAVIKARVMYQAQASLIVQTVSLSDEVLAVLQVLLRELLNRSKAAGKNTQVCKKLVDVLFDGIIDTSDIPGTPSQDAILLALTVFAQASPRLIDSAQLERLEPYTKNLANGEDLVVYRLVLSILRHTMPHLSTLRKDFLRNLQMSLLSNLGKLPTSQVSEVAACLWTIDGELGNTDKLVTVVVSALMNVRKMVDNNSFSDAATVRRVTRLMNLVGQFGKACNLEAHLETVKSRLAGVKSTSVAGIAIEVLSNYTTPARPPTIREAALDAICAICQRWPKHFLRSDVTAAFDRVLKDRLPALETVFLTGLAGFFSTQDGASADDEDPEHGATGRERLARTYVASDHDGATASLSQRFLPHIIRLALASYDELGLIATRLMASIVRQGLPHPKECGPSLIALETSPNAAIAQLAFTEHRTMHEKHETIIEKEYMRALEQALFYQQHVVGDAKGFTSQPPSPKLRLFWEVLKGGKQRVRQKFIGNICQKLGFTPTELDLQAKIIHLAFVRFVLENLALFEYDRSDDLQLLINGLTKTFASSGTSVAQSIESEVFNMTVGSLDSSQPTINDSNGDVSLVKATPSLDADRLKVLAVSAQILLVIHETRMHLVRLWGGQRLLRKEKLDAKDGGKAPTRTSNAASLIDSYIERIDVLMAPLVDSESQRQICREFTEVLSVDSETKVSGANEEDGEDLDGMEGASQTTDLKSPSATPGPGMPKGKKRKSAGGAAGAPKKRVRPSQGKRKSSAAKLEDDEEDAGWE